MAILRTVGSRGSFQPWAHCPPSLETAVPRGLQPGLHSPHSLREDLQARALYLLSLHLPGNRSPTTDWTEKWKKDFWAGMLGREGEGVASQTCPSQTRLEFEGGCFSK